MLRALSLVLPLAFSSPAFAQFTAEQGQAFFQGAGVKGETVVLLVSGSTAALAFGGMAWIAYAAFHQWTAGRTSAGGLASLLLRAAVLLIVIGVFLR